MSRCCFIAIFFLILAVCADRVSAEESCDDPCGKPTPWNDFNVFTLKVTQARLAGYALWHGQYDKDSMDMRIEAEMADDKVVRIGTILMVGGRVMATKGNIATPGYEIDALDAAVLQQQLVFRLLGAAIPGGSTAVKGEQKIDFSKRKTGIRFATPSAQGFIPPPWNVKGTVKVASPDAVEYELHLAAGTKERPVKEGEKYSSDFVGKLSKTAIAKLDDRLSLEGWSAFEVGVQSKKIGKTTITNYGWAPASTVYKTVGDIRKKLATDDYPGERDASKDFTGFWKEKCEQNFGLQIKHYGTDGKYSIAFCGPGGCGNLDESRKTFITGDKNYQVVSEDKIIEIGRSGDNETYIRCTKNPNPDLSK